MLKEELARERKGEFMSICLKDMFVMRGEQKMWRVFVYCVGEE
jgi:hypothetical protein